MSSPILVVPCYNEADNLDVPRFEKFARESGVQLLFVDDGSSDATPSILERLAKLVPDAIEVHTKRVNGGKAAAVRDGMQLAFERDPKIVGFWDADLATPFEELPAFFDVLLERPDVVIVLGSRVQMLGRQIDRHTYRHYGGRVFATLASIVLGLSVYDTQCGAKLFRVTPETRALFAEPFTVNWTFDVELIARLIVGRRGSPLPPVEQALFEVPLSRWRDVGISSVKPSDFFRSIAELVRLRRRYMS
jgi:glycosyltransferase involved in cell wall biosynthesis